MERRDLLLGNAQAFSMEGHMEDWVNLGSIGQVQFVCYFPHMADDFEGHREMPIELMMASKSNEVLMERLEFNINLITLLTNQVATVFIRKIFHLSLCL